MSTPILAWLNCYGAWDPQLRQPIETIGYDQYLNAAAQALASLRDRIATIYVSGGMLDKNSLTECQTTIPELQRRLEVLGFREPTIIADEESVTSISIAKKFLQTWHSEYPDHHPLLFTDAARFVINAHTLTELAKKMAIVLPPIIDILIPLPRLDNHPDSSPSRQAEKLKELQEIGLEEMERKGIQERGKPLF